MLISYKMKYLHQKFLFTKRFYCKIQQFIVKCIIFTALLITHQIFLWIFNEFDWDKRVHFLSKI